MISARPYGHRAVLKFAANTGVHAIAGRFTPGAFTNYITRSFKEPRLIVVTDPRVDHQAIREASYVNIPVIALCDTDAPLKFVDVAIPTNNKSRHSIGLIWWMLCREVLRLKGTIPRTDDGWSVMVDMFFYRDPDEIDKEQEDAKLAKEAAALGGAEAAGGDWDVAGGATGALAAAQEGGKYSLCIESMSHSNNAFAQVLIGLPTLPTRLLVPPTGLRSQQAALPGAQVRRLLVGNEFSLSCITVCTPRDVQFLHSRFIPSSRPLAAPGSARVLGPPTSN